MRTQWLPLLSLSIVASACNVTAGDPAGGPGTAGEAANGVPAGTPAANGGAPAPAGAAPGATSAAGDEGAAFTISNDPAANEVIVIRRDAEGSLSTAGRLATGGKGTGMALGSQGALALSDDGRFLVVVDPGSDEITSFAVNGTSLELRSHVGSGGDLPVSVTMHGNLVYALNAGAASCIAGFRMDEKGMLTAVPDATRSLSAGAAGPAQVSFSPKGDALVVTEKGSNVIDTFVVKSDGTPSSGAAQKSVDMTPYGFAFTPHGDLVVSEAFGGAAGAGALSTYQLGALRSDGAGGSERDLTTLSPSVADHQSAPCWVAVTADGKWAFTTNTASSNVSAYAVDPAGIITLVGDGAAGATGGGSKPIDMALDRSQKHLLVLDAGSHFVVSFTVSADGSLTPGKSGAWVPDTAAGLAGM